MQKHKPWRPIPNSSQQLAIDSRCDETCFTGTRAVGKTEAQLARFRRRVGKGYGSFWKGVIFDQEYKNLGDIVTKSQRMFAADELRGAKFKQSLSDFKWVWPTGEELLFREFKDEKTYTKYHGQEFAYIGWNELTKWPTIDCYEMMMSCNRSSFVPANHPLRDKDGNVFYLPDMPLEVFSTTNSSGPGSNWVRRKFVNPGYGKVVRRTETIFNPRTQMEEQITRSQVCIFGTWRENPYLDPRYIQSLSNMSDPMLRRSWLLGDWDITVGGAFDDVWSRKRHCIPRFRIPKGWRIDRAFDWGSTHPFWVGWFAEANGEEVMVFDPMTGLLKMFCPPAGTIILISEWYGTEEVGTNKGLKLSAKAISNGIKEHEAGLLKNGWIHSLPEPGPADNQISQVTQVDVETIEKKMQDEGIYWERSDKSQGSRENGMQLFRDRLEASSLGEGPGFYVMDNCQATLEIVPKLQRDKKKPDDVDTVQEDHPWDGIRYRTLASQNRHEKGVVITSV